MKNKASLVVYFSHSGNTKYVAQLIAEATGSNQFELVPEIAYPTDYEACTQLAALQKRQDARPSITRYVENLDQYDTIYIGFPNWWNTMPMMVVHFLEEMKLHHKTIKPFITHGGGGVGDCIKDLKLLVPNDSIVKEPLMVFDSKIKRSQQAIMTWLMKGE